MRVSPSKSAKDRVPYPLRAPRHQITGGITNKQDIKESQELLQSAEDMMERRRQRVERFGLAPSESYGSTGRALSFCALVSKKERARLKGTAVERCDRDLFAIAGIGDIRKRTAARFRTPKNPRPRCMRRSVAQDLHRLWKAISRRSSSRAQIACSIPSFTERGALWSGFCIRSQTSSLNSSKFCPRW